MDVTVLNKIERHTTRLLTEHLSNKMVYHDIAYVHRVIAAINEIGSAEEISQEELDLLIATGWLINLGFTNSEILTGLSGMEDLFARSYRKSAEMSQEFLAGEHMADVDQERIYTLMKEVSPGNEVTSQLGKILSDAITTDWGRAKSKGKIKNLYEEFLLTGAISYGKSTWYDAVLGYLRGHKFLTDYGRNELEKGKLQLIAKIEKDKKSLDKTSNTLIKKELNLTDDELKKLKKSLSSVKGRDDRGIQTLFRTTSRNHYTLNQMVDRKASIMISINAILLSLIISRTIGQIDTFCIHNSPILIMLLTSIMSMVFAVSAITPFKTQGTFTEAEIREKKGNLLYYGNFHNMDLRDFEWGMHEMLSDGNFLYSTMVRDLYFLGKTLHKKSRMIRLSLGLFILGLVLSTTLFVLVSTMDDFHLGVASHI